MNPSLVQTGVWIVVFLVSSGLFGCKKPQAAAPAAPPPPPGVNVVSVQPKTLPIEFTEVGQTAASRRVEIRSRIDGYISRRLFEEGAKVTEGQLLYEIDPRQFEVALQQAEARLMSAQASLEQAEKDVERLTPLVQAKSISRKELDDAEASRKLALASIASANADIAKAKLDLSYTKITSPVTGTIGLTLKQEGSYVDTVNNSLLTTALKTDPMYVNFSIPERSMLRYRRDVEVGRVVIPTNNEWVVKIELLDGSVYDRTGKLTIVGFQVNETTGTSLFRAEIPNTDGRLIDGQFVKVRLQGAVRPNVIAVPQRAVQMGDQGAFVYVVENGKAAIRPVVTGEWSLPDWIINDGLKAGDVVITDGVQKIGPGAPVTILPSNASASTQAAQSAPASSSK